MPKRYEFRLAAFAGGAPFEQFMPALNELGAQGYAIVSVQSLSAQNGFGGVTTMFLSALMQREIDEPASVPQSIVESFKEQK